jgi:hypothetical protein
VSAVAENRGLARLSLLDTLRVAGVVLLPPLAQGVIIRRPRVVGLAERLKLDRRSGRLLRKLRDRYGPGPLLLRIPVRDVALAVSQLDVERLLAGTPRPFSPATREKKAALRHFEPSGVLVSNEEQRAIRRPFNEAVLGYHDPTHRLQAHVAMLVAGEVDELVKELPHADDARVLTWPAFAETYWRVVRQLVLGRAARDDQDISALMKRLRRRANWAYFAPVDRSGLQDLADRLRMYVASADSESLAGIVASMPAPRGLAPTGQMPQWLFAFDAAAMATYRALALLASHPSVAQELADDVVGSSSGPSHESPRDDQHEAGGSAVGPRLARAVLLESVRLWPTTPLVLRESLEPTIWASGQADVGTTFVVVSSYFHREAARASLADTFNSEIWSGGATTDEAFVPFSAGPAACAGRTIVLDVAGAVLSRLVATHRLTLHGEPPRLAPDRPLPRTLDQTTLRIGLASRPRVDGRNDRPRSTGPGHDARHRAP